mmetsp:Transcript_21729/g.30476  ORF Transcript_21729/g.30476 Transcript_21729/m.30476 type:complete len:144 (+) Transcript_21729:857-1288(+)
MTLPSGCSIVNVMIVDKYNLIHVIIRFAFIRPKISFLSLTILHYILYVFFYSSFTLEFQLYLDVDLFLPTSFSSNCTLYTQHNPPDLRHSPNHQSHSSLHKRFDYNFPCYIFDEIYIQPLSLLDNNMLYSSEPQMMSEILKQK